MSRIRFSRTQILVTLGILSFIVLLAFMIAPNPIPVVDDDDPFTGRWHVNGVDALDVEYSGTLDVVVNGDAYDLQWLITGGIQAGSGRVVDGRLEATWTTTEGIGPIRTGTVSYSVRDETLQGTTTVDGADGSGSEEAFPPN